MGDLVVDEKMILKCILQLGSEGGDWIQLALVRAVMNILFP
jgi:hypothetical protein